MNSRNQQLKAFNRLLDIMDDLRDKCPWDQKQTLESLRHLTIEETYELGDAILDGDLNEIKNVNTMLIKSMVDSFTITDEQFIENNYLAKINVSFEKKKGFKFFI